MSAKQKDVGSSPAHDQKKSFLCRFLFDLMRLFSQFFKMSSKGPPFIFSCFAKKWMFKNSQRPPFYIFRHYANYRRPKNIRKKNFEKKFRKIWDFYQFFSHAGTVERNS